MFPLYFFGASASCMIYNITEQSTVKASSFAKLSFFSYWLIINTVIININSFIIKECYKN